MSRKNKIKPQGSIHVPCPDCSYFLTGNTTSAKPEDYIHRPECGYSNRSRFIEYATCPSD